MTRASQQKGTAFETLIAKGLARALEDDRIERRAKSGAKDRGDIGGVRVHGQRVVIECKSCQKLDLPAWVRQAQIEAGNDDALVGVVCHKRRGTTDPLKQWVSMTVEDFCALLTGHRMGEME